MANMIKIATNKKTGRRYIVTDIGPKFVTVQSAIFNVRLGRNGRVRYTFEKTIKVLASFVDIAEVEATFDVLTDIAEGKPASVLAAEVARRRELEEQRAFERELMNDPSMQEVVRIINKHLR